MKLLLPRRRLWRAAIYIVSTSLVLLAGDMILVRWLRVIQPGYDTTRITAPSLPGGSIDYLTALDDRFGQGVTPENNAAPLLLAAWGRKAIPSNEPPDGLTDRLGMPHLPENGDYFVEYDDFAKKNPALVQANQSTDGPDELVSATSWPVTITPLTAAWIKANQKPLDLVVQASKRPRLFFPFYAGHRPDVIEETLLPQLQFFRQTTLAVSLRALTRLQDGDAAGFEEDLMAPHRLARLLGEQVTIIEMLVGHATAELACQAERIGASSGKIPPAQLETMIGELAAPGDFPSTVANMNIGERYMMLDCLQALATLPDDRAAVVFQAMTDPRQNRPLSFPPFVYRLVPVPWEQSMRVVNHAQDGLIAAMSQPSYALSLAALEDWDSQLAQMRQSNPVWMDMTGEWPMMTLTPSSRNFLKHDYELKAEIRLTQVALALAVYKAAHGAYPAALTDLSPDELASVPLDPFVDRPFVYAPTAKGFTLYSVGPNMVDDRGKTVAPADDIAASVP